MSEIIEVRKEEQLPFDQVNDYIDQHIEGVPHEPLQIKQFSAGHSNLTYLLKRGDWEAVLRRPPLGPIAPRAHDMEREYTWLSRLHPHFQIAPKPYTFSDDETVIGAPFFIMERRKGLVFDTEIPSSITYEASMGNQLSHLMVDTLVQLHAVDPAKANLLEMTKPEGFMERQANSWTKRYQRVETTKLPDVERLMDYLVTHVPKTAQATIIHYDYKLNNAMFSEDLSQMTGLFDWEMSTVGDPLVDLAVAMSYWIEPDDPDILKYALGNPPVTVMNGFYTRQQFIEAYAKKSGRDVSNIHYYMTFAYFKLAVIGQQIYYRYAKGQTTDSRFKHFDHLVSNMIQLAVQTMDEAHD